MSAKFKMVTATDFWRQWYGGVESVIGTGKARCRICGRVIARGSAAFRVAHDFHGSGSYTATMIQAHADCAPRPV